MSSLLKIESVPKHSEKYFDYREISKTDYVTGETKEAASRVNLGVNENPIMLYEEPRRERWETEKLFSSPEKLKR